MDNNLFKLAGIFWIVCALVPIMTTIIKKTRSIGEIKIFAAGFVIYFVWIAAALFTVTVAPAAALMIVMPVGLVALFNLFSDYYGDDAAVLSFGMSQGSLAVCALWAIICIGNILTIDDPTLCACHAERVSYHHFSLFMILAAARTAAAFASASAMKKICSSEKMSGTRAGILAAIISAAGIIFDFIILVSLS